MPKIIQITCSLNTGSIGRIAEQINALASRKGWEPWYAYSRYGNTSQSNLIHVGNRLDMYEHYLENRLFDNEGLASRTVTRKFVSEIDKIQPDIIHLHNIHDHWMNYQILFEYLNKLDTPVVWTLHDCWTFTGGCYHFSDCYKWLDEGCNNNCPALGQAGVRHIFEKTEKHYHLKKKLLSSNSNLTIVPVSYWMEGLVKDSFLKEKNVVTIQNGIDLQQFRPLESNEIRNKYSIGNLDYVIGVSSVWLPYKGWDDFLKLSELLPQGVKLVLVGLDGQKVKEAAKYGIIGIPKTESVAELAALYSGAICFCNLTYQDTFPTTNLESQACGTPVITYRTGGSPEAISEHTGFVVDQGDLKTVCNAIDTIRSNGKDYYAKLCRDRAEQCFNKEDRFEDYINLYESLLGK